MTIELKQKAQNTFSTREELNQMTIFQLSIKAMESKLFREIAIDFLVSREYTRGVFHVQDIKMSRSLKSDLYKNNIKTLNELTFFKIKDVCRITSMGEKKMHELIDIMNRYDFQFDSHIEGLRNLKST